MLDPLFDVIAIILAWFYSIWPSYGMSIAFLTLTVMVAATPFTLKGIRSMLQMSQYTPELKRIQNEHRGDRQATNEATMAFYKEHRINPAGSCLPMLIQAPIFIVLYQVLRGLTRRTTEIGTQIGFTSLRYADGAHDYGPTPIARQELTFDPDFLARDTDLYVRLSDSTQMVSWGIDLSRTASTAMGEGVVVALPYLVMLVLVMVTGLYQQRQIQGRQSGAVINKQQQMIMKMFPYFLPVISYTLPAALVVYFIVSALYRIAQQAYITRSLYTGEDSLGAQAAKLRAASTAQTSDAARNKPAKSSPATTDGKGAPTHKRDARATRGKAPVRKHETAHASRSGKAGKAGKAGGLGKAGGAGRAGRTGKAPSRSRSGSPRGTSHSGRTTAPGSGPARSSQNRSKNKKKRR